MTKRELENELLNMNIGEKIFINAINLTAGAIKFLKVCIAEQDILLDENELNYWINKKDQDDFIKGKVICPQMTYIRN